MSDAFEATERFLRDLGAEFYWQKRGRLALTQKKAFQRANGKLKAKENTPEYLRQYVNWICRRNCHALLKTLRREVPEFEHVSCAYPGYVNLFDVFAAIEFCRHAVVHSNGRVNSHELAKKDASVRKLVARVTESSLLWGESVILPNRERTEEAISLLAGFGYILYRTTSELLGMALDSKAIKTAVAKQTRKRQDKHQT
jgi:hypothetical protein